MASFRLLGAVCAVSIAFVSTTAGAQTKSDRSPAATLWQLRSGLNVAALACRGPEDDLIVAGYNRMLADHRQELATAYSAHLAEYAGPAAFDTAMTKLYNRYATPAAQHALCDAARVVLDEANAKPGQALADMAVPALAMIEDAFVPRPQALPPMTVAAADVTSGPVVQTVAYVASDDGE